MASNQRQFQRQKRRMVCEFSLDGHVCKGIVSDVSARGLLIHTTKHPPIGTNIKILMRDTTSGEITLRCQVVRLLKVHGSAAAIMASGFGAEIDYAPEAFFELLVDMGLG
jgi:hypothetical protein